MRFKVDENLPWFIAQRLRDAGFDAMTVGEQRLSGTIDEKVAELTAAEDRILVLLLETLATNQVGGRLWILDRNRVRVREQGAE